MEYLFKVIVIGEANVGKTSTIRRYVDNEFSNKYKYTIGVDFALKSVEWSKDTTVRLQLWDIAGQERFGLMTHVYYKEAAGACIVFDITQRKTLEAAAKWKADVDSKVLLENGQPVPCILLANKCDLSERPVSKEEIEQFVRQHNFIGWFETSAKANLNIDKAMKTLIHYMMTSGSDVVRGEAGLQLTDQSTEKKQNECCVTAKKK